MSTVFASLPIPSSLDHPYHPSSTPVSSSSFAPSPRSSVLSLDSSREDAEDEIGSPVLHFHSEPLSHPPTLNNLIQPQPPAALKAIPQPLPHRPEPVQTRRNLSTDSTALTQTGSATSRTPSSNSLASTSTTRPHSSSATVISSSSSSSSSSSDNLDLSSIPPAPLPHSVPGVSSTARYGELYTDSMHFDDLPQLAKLAPNLNTSHISELRVWSRNFVHGLQTKYELEGKPSFVSEDHKGKIHTAEYSMKIHSRLGEYIIGVEGTYREWIESLTIITNKQRYTFGRIARNGKFFRCAIPAGHRVVGFFGSYGVHLHNIGVHYQPITVADKTKRGTCLVEKVKAIFRN